MGGILADWSRRPPRRPAGPRPRKLVMGASSTRGPESQAAVAFDCQAKEVRELAFRHGEPRHAKFFFPARH